MQSAAPPGSIGLFISIFLLILIAENLTSGSSSSTRVKKDGAVSATTGKEKIKSSCIPCHLVAGSIKAIKSLMSELELISESHCSSSHNQQIKDDGEETRGARAFLPMHLSPHQMYYHPQLMMHHPAIMSNKINYGQQQQQQNSYIMPRAPARHQQHFVNYNFPRQVTMQSPAFNNRQLKFTQPGPVQQLALIRPQLLSSPITTTPSNVINNPADLTTKENIIIQETSTDINNYDKQNKKKKKKKQMCSKRRSKNKRRKLSNKKQANRVESISLGDDDDDDDEDDDGGNDYSNDRVKGNETTTSTVAAANYHESILPLNRGNLTNYKTDDISSTRVKVNQKIPPSHHVIAPPCLRNFVLESELKYLSFLIKYSSTVSLNTKDDQSFWILLNGKGVKRLIINTTTKGRTADDVLKVDKNTHTGIARISPVTVALNRKIKSHKNFTKLVRLNQDQS